MKCEVEITNVWVSFDIEIEDIISFNIYHNAPGDKLKSFQFAFDHGFDPFTYTEEDIEFSNASYENAHKNTTGKTWCELDKSSNTITK